MYEKLDDVRLKNGEAVELGVVKGPDADWADRIDDDLLGHKGPTWRWGNRLVLEQDLDCDAFFYILHREGVPFSNVMTIEYRGVGILGHVFTRPEDRRQGAASAIFTHLMAHFEQRNGRALVLGTGYDSPPYHIYKSFGFEGLMPTSGVMAFYLPDEATFRHNYFQAGEVVIDRLGPEHYGGMPVLFSESKPGAVRSAGAMRLYGRSSSEGPLIPLLKDELERLEEGKSVRTSVARVKETGAVVGMATTDRDPVWPGTCIVDVFCHDDFWAHGDALLNTISWPGADRYVAYCDVGWREKEVVLETAGFEREAVLKRWISVGGQEAVDVTLWVKR